MEVAMQTTRSPKRKPNRRSAKQWHAILSRFDKSSLTPADFCRQQNLSLPAFHRWQRKRLADAGTSSFVELQPPTALAKLEIPWTLELDLPDGLNLRIRSGL